eukprot:TRINITY_DN97127_c0_g1_i1.p1 TRINITY_DN97127_c0_g1~~TRINITY_DN97127_c0_g1_i1.p1  ORF type:complete len:323 (-),score=63.02 TRINITY_DN97127_c0_g1_i1:23-991(-)
MALLRELAPSVWRIGSGRPRVAILGGVHGNELSGVSVVERLVARLSRGGTKLRGELTLAVGNPDAVERGVRFVEQDLNRCFSEDLVEVPRAEGLEPRRAALLSPLLQGLDALVDLHATNKPSEPFARLPGAAPGRGRRFAAAEGLFLSALPAACRTVLWDPQELIGGGSMTDEYALRHAPSESCRDSAGNPLEPAYICYESGLASDKSSVDAISAAVDTLLARTGVLSLGPPTESVLQPDRWRHFEISDVFKLDERGFEWVDGHGSANFQAVPSGAVFGRRGREELRAPEGAESFIVFPKVQSLWAVGRPLGWLARRIPCPE